jgi:hopene-associated glycosyltransferase HpnB
LRSAFCHKTERERIDMVIGAMWLLAGVWLAYAVFGRRWRIEPRLATSADPKVHARVIAVVPARNEAHELPRTLPSLFAQTATVSVVLVDDHSDDGTADVARRLAAEAHAEDRLIVLTPPPLPHGWAGKVWAQHHGLGHAQRLGAEWIWFTDADIRHDPDVLARLLTTATQEHRDFVSVMARLRCENVFEKLLIPAFTYFFAGLYPFHPIGNDRSREAGAAGGCMTVRSEVLQRVGGMTAIRNAVIDDVSLGRACKAAGARLWLGYDPGVNSTRGYETLADIWNMVARSAYTQLRYNPLALLGCAAGLAYVFFAPIAALLWGHGMMIRVLGLLAYAAMVRTYRPMVRYLGCTPGWALALPLSAALYTGMTISSAWRHHFGTGAAWKGRSYTAGVASESQ